jgi:hypothetical protein
MAGRVKADCGANLIEHSYALNGARFTLVAKRTSFWRHSMVRQFSAKTVECVLQGLICEVAARFGQVRSGSNPVIENSDRTSAKGRKQQFKLRRYHRGDDDPRLIEPVEVTIATTIHLGAK